MLPLVEPRLLSLEESEKYAHIISDLGGTIFDPKNPKGNSWIIIAYGEDIRLYATVDGSWPPFFDKLISGSQKS